MHSVAVGSCVSPGVLVISSPWLVLCSFYSSLLFLHTLDGESCHVDHQFTIFPVEPVSLTLFVQLVGDLFERRFAQFHNDVRHTVVLLWDI